MNTLAVFAVAAPVGIGVIVGFLFTMSWVEQRMLGVVAPRVRAPIPVVEPVPEVPVPEIALPEVAVPVPEQAGVPDLVPAPRQWVPVPRARVRRPARVTPASAAVALVALACTAVTMGWRTTSRGWLPRRVRSARFDQNLAIPRQRSRAPSAGHSPGFTRTTGHRGNGRVRQRS